eukprot:415750_1
MAGELRVSKTAQTYSLIVTIVYFTVYSLVFLITSIFCAWYINIDIKQTNQKNKETNNNEQQLGIEITSATINNTELEEFKTDNNEINIAEAHNKVKKPLSSIFSVAFVKLWTRSVWKKKSIYMSIVPHLFDQATDIGVLLQYYDIMRKQQNTDDKPNFQAQYWFFGSIAVITLHKIISCISVYLLTKSWIDVLYQFVDVLMVKAVYANYKLNVDEPSNGQRYLQILEGTFESGPQILIGLTFILKSDYSDALVLVSLIASLWTLTSRIAADDKSILNYNWKYVELKKKAP